MGDNNGSLALAQNPCDHQKSKHIQVRYHFVRQQVEEGVINLAKVHTKDQLADLLNKSHHKTSHWYLLKFIIGDRDVGDA